MEPQYCPDRFDDSVAIVTGSTHGIGLGTAKRLAREGASVVVNDEGRYDGDAVVAELEELGADAIYVEADAGDLGAIERLIDETVEAFGSIDVLVNNVAGGNHTPVEETNIEIWESVMNTTLRSHWLTSKLAVEHMDDGGAIVNISSILSVQTKPTSFPYNVAKAGVNGLTRALATAYGPLGIRVNAIRPGAIQIATQNPTEEELRTDEVHEPVGRQGAPRDIAAGVSFLASDEAAFVNGVVLPIDGGRSVVFEDGHYAEWWEEQT